MNRPEIIYSVLNRTIYKNAEGVVAICVIITNALGQETVCPVLYDKTKQELIKQQYKMPFEMYSQTSSDKTILKDRLYNTIQMAINSPSGYPFYLPTNIYFN